MLGGRYVTFADFSRPDEPIRLDWGCEFDGELVQGESVLSIFGSLGFAMINGNSTAPASLLFACFCCFVPGRPLPRAFVNAFGADPRRSPKLLGALRLSLLNGIRAQFASHILRRNGSVHSQFFLSCCPRAEVSCFGKASQPMLPRPRLPKEISTASVMSGRPKRDAKHAVSSTRGGRVCEAAWSAEQQRMRALAEQADFGLLVCFAVFCRLAGFRAAQLLISVFAVRSICTNVLNVFVERTED